MVCKTYLCVLVCTLFIGLNSFSQTTFIPDDNFEQALIDLGLDSGPLDNLVPSANINTVTNLDVEGKNISDLTGIEDFIALTSLNCINNQINVLNVSALANLKQLFVGDNLLTTIDVSNLFNLQQFWCFNNQLSNINVTNNPDLLSLRCEHNSISTLNTSNNLILNTLLCQNNQISTLNITTNTNLSRLECGNNLLRELDITNNTKLSYLACEQNQITALNPTNTPQLVTLLCFNNLITELDLSLNRQLTELNCSSNDLCRLNLKNGNNNNASLIDFNLNPDLNCVVVDNANGNHTTWQPLNFSNYVGSLDACSTIVPIDRLPDFIGKYYILPPLSNGNYFTASGGQGVPLNSGDLITTSQSIYIYNESSCHVNEHIFNVIITSSDFYIPKYFTPNNDGKHDVWKVYDANNNIKNITIYNQYGKLIKYLSSSAIDWDGTFKGQPLQSNDYWYLITLKTGQNFKGHFTLKR